MTFMTLINTKIWPVGLFESLLGGIGIPTPLKNDGVRNSWDDDIPFPTEWKVRIQPCSKPPTRVCFYVLDAQQEIDLFMLVMISPQ